MSDGGIDVGVLDGRRLRCISLLLDGKGFKPSRRATRGGWITLWGGDRHAWSNSRFMVNTGLYDFTSLNIRRVQAFWVINASICNSVK